MRNRISAGAVPVALIALSVVAGALDAVAGKAPPRPISHCSSAETVVYSCRFGRNLGSLCGGDGMLHYRYGPPGRPDIDLASAADWGNVRLGHVVGQGGGRQTHVRFAVGDRHYIVFEGVDGSLADRPGRRYSGIFVGRGDSAAEPLAYHHCPQASSVPGGLPTAALAHAPAGLDDGEGLWELDNGPFDAWY